MIRILIVEDLLLVRKYLQHIFESDQDIQVIGMAKDGEEGIRLAQQLKPDVIVMDINMPKMNGFEATRKIMETNAVPIVIASASYDPKEMETSFKAMEAGAVAVLGKPKGIDHPESEETARELVRTVKLMSEVKVITRRPQAPQKKSAPISIQKEITSIPKKTDIKLLAIGASTGGPVVLQTILSKLPKDFPIPILIVQHITVGFLRGLTDWLEKTTGFSIHIASRDENVLPGHVYFAPDDFHLGLSGRRIELSKSAPESGLRPAANYLFRSVAKMYGKYAIGVLLTGMGKDGAESLKQMREQGAITIAQNKESSAVFGMPGEAIKLGAALHILSPEEIAAKIEILVR